MPRLKTTQLRLDDLKFVKFVQNSASKPLFTLVFHVFVFKLFFFLQTLLGIKPPSPTT